MRRLSVSSFVIYHSSLLLTLFIAGCSQYNYPYHPATQPDPLTPIFADYRETPTTIDFLIDTHGYRLDSATLQKSDGTSLSPTSIDQPEFKPRLIGPDTPQRQPLYTAPVAQGPTILHFNKPSLAPPPWPLSLTIPSISPAPILITINR